MDLLNKVNGTLVWYYHICHRQVWLIGHSIEPDQDSDILALGRYIHQFYYKRERKELFIDNQIKIDLLANKKIVGEIKKSSKHRKSAQMQLAFYLYYLKHKGISIEGELLIPEERRRERVVLTPEIEEELYQVLKGIVDILQLEKPPKPQKIPYCKNCAYREMCWS